MAIETIKYLVDNLRIRSEEDLRNYVKSSKFLSDYFTEYVIETLVGLIKPSQLTILKASDLGKLRQEDYRRRKEKEFFTIAKKKAEKELEGERKKAMEEMHKEREHLEKLRSVVQEKMDEVRKMESVLDSLPKRFDPEDYIILEKKKLELRRPKLWWQKIGLIGDPFPTKLGLNRIPQEKYEDIVVVTKLFKEYLRMIEYSPETLFGKTILIAGHFGSGKTTFLQYVSYRLAPYKVIPFQIVLDPVGEIDALRQNFFSEILTSLSKAMFRRGLPDPRPEGATLEKSTIQELLTYLSKEAQIDGYVIMIDGLHKAESTIDTSLEFVKQLQNFHEYLDNYNINVSIFVTGSPLWLRKIKQNPAYSGSYYKVEEMPYLTFDNAYEFLQKRFKAYASPNIPVFFAKSTVRFAYDCVYSDLERSINFRAFINYILPRLEKGDLKEIGISVSVDIEDVQRIDSELKKSAISDSYSIFRQFTKNKPKLRRACETVLRLIYRKSYIDEDSRRFLSNKGAMYVLRKSHIIRKAKTKKGLGWTLRDDFLAVLDDLNEQGYPPVIVFQAFSVIPRVVLERVSSDDPVLIEAKDFLAKWESEWPEIVPSVRSFIKRHEKIVAYSISGDKAKLCEDCRSSLTDLIESAQIIFKNSESSEDWLDNTWLDFPIKSTILSILREENVPEKEAIDYFQRYHHSTIIMLEKLEELLEINRMINILSSKNRRKEMRVLFNAGNYLRNGDLENAIEETNSSIETRLRVAFHLAFSLHFGSDYFDKIPTSVRERILNLDTKGPSSLRRTRDRNLFYHFSRSEYAEVVNNKSNWSKIFEKVFSPRSREEVVKALQATFALDDRKQHRDRKDYFREKREEIRKAIYNADWLFTSLVRIFDLSLNPSGFIDEKEDDYHKVRVSFVGSEQCASSHPLRIGSSKEAEIARRLSGKTRIINLVDDIAISTLFDGTLAEIFITIIGLLKNHQIEVQKMPEGDMYLEIIPIQ